MATAMAIPHTGFLNSFEITSQAKSAKPMVVAMECEKSPNDGSGGANERLLSKYHSVMWPYFICLSTKLSNSEIERITYKDLLVDISSIFCIKSSFQNFGQSLNTL